MSFAIHQIRRLKATKPSLWLPPVVTFAALYLYRPFVLGFYSDDWNLLAAAVRNGGPFSLERLSWCWETFARPLMNVEIYLGTSILGSSVVAWQFFMIILVAITCFVLYRFLLALGARPTAASLASTVWLVFPWSLGYRAWPVCSAILLSTICYLAGSIYLLKRRLLPALIWYGASLLLYEAFYLQFLVILIVLVSSAETRRWALRRAAPLLVVIQAAAVLINRLAATYTPSLAKSYQSDWYVQFARSLPRIPLTMSEGIVGGSTLALVTIEVALVLALVAACRTRDFKVRVALLAAVAGVVISALVLSVAGYYLAALNTASRTFVAVDIWIVVFLAVSWERPLHGRLHRWVYVAAAAAVFLVLSVSTIVRTDNWKQIWNVEQDVIEAVPAEAVAATGREAVIILTDFPCVGNYPPFWSKEVMTNAVASRRSDIDPMRTFYPAGYGASVSWDGESLLRNDAKVMETSEVWLWRWPAHELELVTEPGRIF